MIGSRIDLDKTDLIESLIHDLFEHLVNAVFFRSAFVYEDRIVIIRLLDSQITCIAGEVLFFGPNDERIGIRMCMTGVLAPVAYVRCK